MSDKNIVNDLCYFLDKSPTAWHAVLNLEHKLKKSGFVELKEEDKWTLQPKKRYYVKRNGSSLLAFITPQENPQAFHIAASHTDSPAFKLKPNCEWQQQNMTMLGAEVYGAVILSSWLNRDLIIAGRVLAQRQGNSDIIEEVVSLDDYPIMIPQLAFHLEQGVNKNGLLLNPQEHLNAIAALNFSSHSKKSYLETILQKSYGIDKILAHDLFLVPKEPAALIGYNNEMIATWRIDSLSSVHAIIQGISANIKIPQNKIYAAVFWDNEEIGSSSAQGAGSPFLMQNLQRALHALGGNIEDFYRAQAASFCLSVDQAHALHPNYQEKHDARHQPLLGKGIAIKHNAAMRYATDAKGAAFVAQLCEKNKISYQKVVNRNDMPSGSTIGPIHATLSGMPTVDIGAPQLSMHSCRELMSTEDHISMCQLLTHYFAC